MKKFFCFILSILIVIPSMYVSATQDRSYNFNKNYSLSGNYANDIVSVARAQKGRTKASLGYTEMWCADFATDCARLTGMPDNIIPYNYSGRGLVANLYSYILNYCNAQVVSDRQAGDLVFYYCPSCNRYVHVGIVADGTYSFEGNVNGQVYQMGGGNGQYIDSNGHKVSSGQVQRIYVRPAYSGATQTPPSDAWIWSNKSLVAVNEEISFNYNASGATGFVLGIDKEGVGRVRTVGMDGNDWYTTTFSEAGTYTIYATCYNAIGGVDSPTITFTVYDSIPSEPWIWSNKSLVAVNEEISFNYNASGATAFVLGIDKEGAGRVRTVGMDGNDWYTTTFSEAGTYTIYATCYNAIGGIDSPTITFTVYDTIPKDPWIKTDNTNIPINQDVTFTFDATYAVDFYLGIDSEVNGRIETPYVNGKTYTTKFENPGKYTIYATCCNAYGGIDSEKLVFSVYDPNATPTPKEPEIPIKTRVITKTATENLSLVNTVYAELENLAARDIGCDVILVYKYADGSIAKTDIQTVKVPAKQTLNAESSVSNRIIDLGGNFVNSVEVYVWNSADGMIPLAEKKIGSFDYDY